ncbi:hypothetical protein KSF78_0006006 [Schistosoma japonicum]|nr:hypothetical protein KSF78_0006006 [Schistosoma japonicum]
MIVYSYSLLNYNVISAKILKYEFTSILNYNMYTSIHDSILTFFKTHLLYTCLYAFIVIYFVYVCYSETFKKIL